MSRIGLKPVNIPANVEVNIDENNFALVKGPKGQLEQQLPKIINIEIVGDQIIVSRESDEKEHKMCIRDSI